MHSFGQNSPTFADQSDSPIFPLQASRRSMSNSLRNIDHEFLKEKEQKLKKNKKVKKKKHKEFQQGQCSQEQRVDPSNICYLMTNSDIKFHVVIKKFHHLAKQRKEYLQNKLKDELKEKFGKIQNFTKIHIDQVQLWLIGFQKDTIAYQFLFEAQGFYKVIFEDKTTIQLTVEPTQAFNRFWNSIHEYIQAHKVAPKIQWETINQTEKNYKKKFIIQETFEENQQNFEKNRGFQRIKQVKNQDKQKQFFRQLKNPKPLIIWGIPVQVSKRSIVPEMKKASIIVRNVGNSKWIRIANSYSQILQIEIQSNYIDQALQQLANFKINDQICLVTQAPNSHSQIYQVISKYQIKLTFSKALNASVVYRALDSISPIVDMCKQKQVSNDNEDQCKIFYITFTKKQIIQQLLQIGNEIQGLSILPVDKCIYIYRRIHNYNRVPFDLQNSQKIQQTIYSTENAHQKQKNEQKDTYQNYQAKDDFDY